MLEISEEMNIFIENKLSRNNLNTDDDVNLSELLTLINSDRNFNKFYRDLAIAWR